MKTVLVAGVVAVMGSWGGVEGSGEDVVLQDCDVEREVDLTVEGDGVQAVFVDSGSGELIVEGRADARGIVVRGTACASDEELLEMLDVTATRSGSLVSLETHYPTDRDRWGGGNRTARLDLTIIVPQGTEIEIVDRSGGIEVRGTGAVTIDDGSGGLDVRDIDGDVVIEDGSGGVEISDVRGEVLLRDGSGGIDIRDVTRNVRIVEDGSGSIRVDRVGGDFLVGRDGSGSIRHSSVEGRVEVPERRRRGRGRG